MLGALKKVGGKVAVGVVKAAPGGGAAIDGIKAVQRATRADAETTARAVLQALGAYLSGPEMRSVERLILALADQVRGEHEKSIDQEVWDVLTGRRSQESLSPAGQKSMDELCRIARLSGEARKRAEAAAAGPEKPEAEKPEPAAPKLSFDPNERLTDNFRIREFLRSDTADRLRIANVPHSQEVLDNLRNLCVHILQPISDHFKKDVLINSGYRSPELNAAVTGNPNSPSQHSRGEAADIEIRGVSNHALASWIRGNLPFDQLILENHTKGDTNSGWVHVSRSPSGRQRGVEGHPNAVLTMVYTTVMVGGKTKRKPKYLKGLVV